jgi:hypothetical protein
MGLPSTGVIFFDLPISRSCCVKRLNKYGTILFFISLFFLALHAAYDGIVLDEAEDWGVTLAQYFFYLALIYLTIPSLGLFLVRRLNPIGWMIVGLYAMQVMYGAGITDDQPMLGVMPRLLGNLGVHISSIQGYGFFSIILEILGFAPVESHAPTIFSSLAADVNIVVNGALILLCLFALRSWWIERRWTRDAGVSGQLNVQGNKIS